MSDNNWKPNTSPNVKPKEVYDAIAVDWMGTDGDIASCSGKRLNWDGNVVAYRLTKTYKFGVGDVVFHRESTNTVGMVRSVKSDLYTVDWLLPYEEEPYTITYPEELLKKAEMKDD